MARWCPTISEQASFFIFKIIVVLFSILLYLSIVEIVESFHLLCLIKNLFPSESCKETQIMFLVLCLVSEKPKEKNL